MTQEQLSVLLAAYITATAEAITLNTIEMRAAFKVLEKRGLLKASEVEQAIRQTSPADIEKVMTEVQAKVMKSIVDRFPDFFSPSPSVQ